MYQNNYTLLVYLAGDNNLSKQGESDLNSIIESSKGQKINIVVQFDRSTMIESKTIRYHIYNGRYREEVLDETNTGDPIILKNFIEESSALYPSSLLILIIWSHGSGVDDFDGYNLNNLEERTRPYYFVQHNEIREIGTAYDDESKDFLDNIELQKALSSSVKIDILGFDACLMGMFEIAYQVKNQANMMIASQHTEPSDGWDYATIIQNLSNEISKTSISKNIVDFYGKYYEDKPFYVTQSAYKIDLIDEVAKAIDIFAKFLIENLRDNRPLEIALRETEKFSNESYIDLIDFVYKINERIKMERLSLISNNLLHILEQFIVANSAVEMPNVHGISIYFPTEKHPSQETFEKYELLDFSKEYSSWIGLIRWYYGG